MSHDLTRIAVTGRATPLATALIPDQDAILVLLVEHREAPSEVMIIWPDTPTTITPDRLSSLQAALDALASDIGHTWAEIRTQARTCPDPEPDSSEAVRELVAAVLA